jgi:hypothetical protein
MSVELKDMGLGLEETEANQGDVGKDQARAFSASQHSEDWKHAIRSNPKALLWCQCPHLN